MPDVQNKKRKAIYVFIDASNLFYEGEKSLGWKIDYKKLYVYLHKKYQASKIFYFGGVEIHNYQYDYLANDTVPIFKLKLYLEGLLKNKTKSLSRDNLDLINKHLQRISFYAKLSTFGYELFLKPVKLYNLGDGLMKRKANCDVDMSFQIMKVVDNFDMVIFLSGDGDFLPILKYLRKIGKEVIVLSRGPRTAKEIKQLAGGNFRDFEYIRKYIEYK
ncbi:MAG: NYN domain-containing protein [Candidatus Paceibacterota bacterium]